MARSTALASKPTYLIESVDSALRLLHEVGNADRLRVSEVAERLDVAPSTAHRLLAMLQYHGFVEQDRRTREYHAGPELLRLGLAAAKRLDLRAQARPVMEDLSSAVEETIGLGILQGANVLYIEGVDGPRTLRIVARVGALLPAYSIAMGKVLLSELTPALFNGLYPRQALSPLTARTVRTKAELLKQIAKLRRTGYAHSSGESVDGVASIAQGIYDQNGALCAAMSVAAPTDRASPEAIKSWLPHLHAATAKLRGVTAPRGRLA